MGKRKTLLAVLVVNLLMAVVTVHYAEEALLPVVEKVRLWVYGEQPYSSALLGCEALDSVEGWVHPVTLALTVYGDAQAVLESEYGANGREVLPRYANARSSDGELRCVAEYLMENSQRTSMQGLNVRVFAFPMPLEQYNMPGGWVSGLAQSLVGQIFLANYLSTGGSEFLQAAEEAGNLLSIDVADGGVRVELEEQAIWFAEYASLEADAPLVLNGHLLVLDFLYWMTQIDVATGWQEVFDAGLAGAVSEIDEYESIAWSYYDQHGTLATRKYQSFHVRQLDRYASYDESGKLRDAGNRMQWQLLVPAGIFQRLLTQPSRLLLFLTMFVFTVYLPIAALIYKRVSNHAVQAH